MSMGMERTDEKRVGVPDRTARAHLYGTVLLPLDRKIHGVSAHGVTFQSRRVGHDGEQVDHVRAGGNVNDEEGRCGTIRRPV